MGLFDKLFRSESDVAKEEIKKVPWDYLTHSEQLKTMEEESFKRTIVVFKHSTRCGISRMVLRNFENAYKMKENAPVELWFLDLLAHRDLSDEIAARFGVRHESPQLLILKEGKVVHHASHQDIDPARIPEFL